MTNRHVANEFARVDAGAPAFRKDERSQNPPVVLIDFGGIYDDLPDLHRVESILYLAAEGEPDVALLKLKEAPGRLPPPPIPLQTVEPAGRTFPRDAFVVGFPTTDPSDSRVPDLFRTLRVKRVSLGQIKGESDYDQQKRLYHNCTTLGGSSGSPLVDFETGTVWGLHFYGRVQSPGLEGNLAEPMWRVAAVPAIGELLGPAAMSESLSFSVPEAVAPVPPTQKAARPVLFVQRDDIAPGQPFPDEWFAAASAEHGHVRASLPGVGLVRSRDRTGAILSAATGFLVAPELVLSFRTPWQPKVKRHKRQGVFVDFAKTVDDEDPSRRFRVSEIVYDDDLLALLRLEPDADLTFPEPLPLARERPLAATRDNAKVFLVGHPAAGAGFGDPSAAQSFPPPYLVKRLALGYIQGADVVEPSLPGADLQHDCSTSVGDAGGPVIALGTGQVLGVHIGGESRRGNFAISMWTLLSKPEFGAYLS
jgi:Trypsin-like peptidase domain